MQADIYSQLLKDVLGAAEESSAEDEQIKKEKEQSSRRQKDVVLGKKPVQSLPQRPPPTALIKKESFSDVYKVPVVKEMSKFIEENPHQRFDSNDQPVCKAAKRKLQVVNQAEQKKKRKLQKRDEMPALEPTDNDRQHIVKLESILKSSEWEIDESHEEQSNYVHSDTMSRPWQAIAMDEVVRDAPEFFLKDQAEEIGQDHISTMLQRRQVVLQTLTAEFESKLLYQSGRWQVNGVWYDFPPCKEGTSCIASRYPEFAFRGQTCKVVMTALMFPDEYDRFMRDKIVPPSRPCILCCRDQLISMVTRVRTLRANNASVGSGHPSYFDLNIHNGFVYQLYKNLFGCEGGYYEEYMLRPEPGEVMIEPICRLNMSICEMKQHPISGRWLLDTEHMHWRPPSLPQPQPGVKFSDFGKGVYC